MLNAEVQSSARFSESSDSVLRHLQSLHYDRVAHGIIGWSKSRLRILQVIQRRAAADRVCCGRLVLNCTFLRQEHSNNRGIRWCRTVLRDRVRDWISDVPIPPLDQVYGQQTKLEYKWNRWFEYGCHNSVQNCYGVYHVTHVVITAQIERKLRT